MNQRVIIASENPVKINAVRQAFSQMFPPQSFDFIGVNVLSGVSSQPLSDEETYQGALNRTNNAAISEPNAEYWVGIEGGLEEKDAEFEAFAWVVVRGKNERYGKGRTATFFLPDEVGELIRQGKELGHASDVVFKEDNSKQKQGSIGLLTGNAIDRTRYYLDSAIIALIPFKNPQLYFK